MPERHSRSGIKALLLLTLALDEGEWLASFSGRFISEGQSWYQLYTMLCSPQSQSIKQNLLRKI
jgi:hypothetical protein